MSGLPAVIGHEDVRAALGRAVLNAELPGSILLHGPVGVGKQRLGLWLAQRLVCERSTDLMPCNECRPCLLALRVEHPDVHWFFPLPRPKSGGGADKLGEALEEARAEELAARRQQPWRATEPTELAGIYLAQVLALRRMAQRRPAMGKRSVFLIGDAEQLATQEASQEAANALLKLLEEPPSDTVFVLTARDPDELLPTIRSRLLPVRVRALPEDVVVRVLLEVTEVDELAARLAARLSEGSIGRALAFLPRDGAPGSLESARQHARFLLEAALNPKPVDRLSAALATSPAGARAGFADTLDFLALWARDLGAVADGAPDLVINADAVEGLKKMALRFATSGRGAADALRRIDLARGLTRSNINPQLALASLLKEIGEAFVRPN